MGEANEIVTTFVPPVGMQVADSENRIARVTAIEGERLRWGEAARRHERGSEEPHKLNAVKSRNGGEP